MSESMKPGDPVEWTSSGGKSVGRVKKKLTKPTEIKGHHVAASPDDPQFLVESDKTGAQAAHKPASLKKTSAGATKKPASKKSPAGAAKRAGAKKSPSKKQPAAKKTAARKTAAKRR